MRARQHNNFIKRFLYIAGAFFLLAFIQACSSHTEVVSLHHPTIEKPAAVSPTSGKRKIIVENALNSIGIPYHWGGTSPETGFDCSGLIVYTHQKARVNTPRTAKDLYTSGRSISKKELNPADLVFFRHPNSGKAIHVGIYIGDNIFIHAPGRGRQVTSASLDNPYFRRYYLGSRTFI